MSTLPNSYYSCVGTKARRIVNHRLGKVREESSTIASLESNRQEARKVTGLSAQELHQNHGCAALHEHKTGGSRNGTGERSQST